MHWTHDSEADAFYLYFYRHPEDDTIPSVTQQPRTADVVIDRDETGRVIGLEILGLGIPAEQMPESPAPEALRMVTELLAAVKAVDEQRDVSAALLKKPFTRQSVEALRDLSLASGYAVGLEVAMRLFSEEPPADRSRPASADEPKHCPRCGSIVLQGQFRNRRGEIVTHWCETCHLGGNLS